MLRVEQNLGRPKWLGWIWRASLPLKASFGELGVPQAKARAEPQEGKPTCLGWKLPFRSQLGMGMMKRSS